MELYKGRGAVCTPIYERNGLASVNQGRLQPTRTTTICTTYSEYAFLATTPPTHPPISHLMQNVKVQASCLQPRQPPCAWHNYFEYACLLLPPPPPPPITLNTKPIFKADWTNMFIAVPLS